MSVNSFFGLSIKINKEPTDSIRNPDLSTPAQKKISVLSFDQLKILSQFSTVLNVITIFSEIQTTIGHIASEVKVEGNRAYKYFSNHSAFYKLRKVAESVFSSFNKTPFVKAQTHHLSSPWTISLLEELEKQREGCQLDEIELTKISHLRSTSFNFEIGEEVFEALFCRKKLDSHIAILPKVIELMKNGLGLSCLEAIKTKAEKAILFRHHVNEIGGDPCEKIEALKDLSCKMSNELKVLSPGKTYLVFGEILKENILTSPFFASFFRRLLPKELFEFLTGKNLEEISDKLAKKVSNQLEELIGMAPTAKRVGLAIKGAMSGIQKKIEGALPEKAYAIILESLTSDLKEFFFGELKADHSETLVQKVWQELREKGIERALQETLFEMFKRSRQSFDIQLGEVYERITKDLSVEGQLTLEMLGFPRGGSVWFEFKKGINGNYDVTLFAKGAMVESHLTRVPLTYSNIDISKLDQFFFYSLLQYRSIPSWDSSVKFQVVDMYKGLMGSLGKLPDPPDDQTLDSAEDLSGEGVWGYLSLYLRHHMKIDSLEFDKKYGYHFRLQVFIHMWAGLQKSPTFLADHPSLARSLKMAIGELSDVGLKLYHNGKLTFQELRALYATAYEVDLVLKQSRAQPKAAVSVMIPSGFQETLKQCVLAIGILPTRISLIKEILAVFLGPEIEEVVDQTVKDILPTLTADEMNEAYSRHVSSSRYSWEGMKRIFLQCKNFRVSLLHVARLYFLSSRMITDFSQVTLISSFIGVLLNQCFSLNLACSAINIAIVSQILACFSPFILKSLIPSPLYQSVRASYRLYRETVDYVLRRLICICMRPVVRILMGKSTNFKLTLQAKNIGQQMTHAGELTYYLPERQQPIVRGKIRPQEESLPTKLISKQRKKPKSKNALPRPYKVILTEKNVEKEIERWILESSALPFSYQMLFYLNRQIQQLPFPQESELWDKIDPIEGIELISQLISQFGKLSYTHLSINEQTELVTTYYKAYLLIDYLVRRLPEGEIPHHLRANGCALIDWLQSPTTQIIDPKIRLQLEKICNYFGFDSHREYKREEIDSHHQKCLFNYRGIGRSFYSPALVSKKEGGVWKSSYFRFLLSPEGSCYRTFLKKEKVQARLRGCGVSQKASEWERFLTLFKNQPGSLGTPLPKAFSYLREIDFLAKESVQKREIPSLEFSIWKTAISNDKMRQLEGAPVCRDRGVDQMSGLSLEEKEEIEKLTLNREGESIENILKFFMKDMNRVNKVQCRHLFDLLISRAGALSMQIDRRKGVGVLIGRFFYKVLEQLESRGAVETLLFLTKVGQDLKLQMGDCAEGTFPDFRSFIRHRLIPKLRKAPFQRREKLLLSYEHLIFMYEMEASPLTEEALEDVACLIYTLVEREESVSETGKPDVRIRSERSCFFLKLQVKRAMRENQAFRKRVIENLLKDIGMGSVIRREDRWKGEYPIFSNGTMTIDLINHTRTAYQISIKMASQRAAETVKNPGHCIRLSKSVFVFPEKEMILQFSQETSPRKIPCRLIFQFNQGIYEYLPPERLELELKGGKSFSLGEDEKLYLETNPKSVASRHLLCRAKGKALWKRKVRLSRDKKGNPCFEFPINKKEIRGVVVQEVDLSKETNGLGALSWFETEIKAYTYFDHPKQLAFIEMPKWDLRFEIKEIEAKWCAVSLNKTPGYFLAKVQYSETLFQYGRYLLLENGLGKRKVHIVTKPLKVMLANFIFKNLNQSNLSSLFEHYFEVLTPNVSSVLDYEKRLLTFDMDQNGHLQTSDPIALAYLVLSHFVSGNLQECRHYFSKLECYGRKSPYPKAIYPIFNLIFLPLLCGKDHFSREIALRLGAILAENRLIQQSKKREEGGEEMELFKWMLFQLKLTEEINLTSRGAPPILNPIQELFLLEEIIWLNQRYYKKHIDQNLPEELRDIFSQMGIKTFSFAPRLIEHYHQLRNRLKNDSSFKEEVHGPIIQSIESTFDKAKKCQKGEGNRLMHLVNELSKSQLIKPNRNGREGGIDYQCVKLNATFTEVPTTPWELNGNALEFYFPHYYRLAKNEPPLGINQVFFDKKRREFLRSLTLTRGEYPPREASKREMLLLIGTHGRENAFCSANDLEREIRETQNASQEKRRERELEFYTFISLHLFKKCRQAKILDRFLNRKFKVQSIEKKPFIPVCSDLSNKSLHLNIWTWVKRAASSLSPFSH